MPRIAASRRTPPEAGAGAALIPAARQARLREYVHAHGAAAIPEMARALGVSESTIRRDLDDLAAQGAIHRAHGGAVALAGPRTTFEPESGVAAQVAVAEKRAIGAAAAAMLEEGQSVVFDSSSTVLEAARATVRRGLTITAVTNDLAIAAVLGAAGRIKVIVGGGTLRPGSNTLLGDPGVALMRELSVDVALLGAHAIGDGRTSDSSIELAAAKRAFAAAAQKVIVLADSGKFGPAAFCTVIELGKGHTVVTDRAIPPQVRVALQRRGIVVVAVTPDAAAP